MDEHFIMMYCYDYTTYLVLRYIEMYYSDKMFPLKRLLGIVSRHVKNFLLYTTIERKEQTI